MAIYSTTTSTSTTPPKVIFVEVAQVSQVEIFLI
jgi:hypothetical protein